VSAAGGLAHALPALAFTAIVLLLGRAVRDPKTPRGDAVVMDLCLGLLAVAASVLWLQVLLAVLF
jgi:hypothetical protein